MNDLKGLRVVVAGAGAVGSVLALVLARRGAAVTLADPAPSGANASGVAAGMLAPLGEALLDPISAGHFDLLKAGRDAWPPLLEALGEAPHIDRSGALILAADPAAGGALQARARILGAELEPADNGFLFTGEDWRLEPRAMLAALHGALAAAGGNRIAGQVSGLESGQAWLQAGGALPADALVLATGLEGGGLTPIKGQILRFPGLGPATGPVLRGHGVYAAPSSDGLIVGATMEEGVADIVIDAVAVARLRAAGARLVPAAAEAPFEAFAGVRAATPDGLPIVGRGDGEGVYVARGARRNGWLLAPLIAEVIVQRLTGAPPSAAARAFDPARFG
jgi:glycine oxidase